MSTMPSKPAPPDSPRGLLMNWIVMCSISFIPTMASAYLLVILFAILPALQLLFLGPQIAILTVFAVLQARMIRRVRAVPRGFGPATAFALILATAVFSFGPANALERWLSCELSDLSYVFCSLLVEIAGFAAAGAILGASSGLAQWLLLRSVNSPHQSPPVGWIPASAVAVGLASAFMMALPFLPLLRNMSLIFLLPALFFVSLAVTLLPQTIRLVIRGPSHGAAA